MASSNFDMDSLANHAYRDDNAPSESISDITNDGPREKKKAKRKRDSTPKTASPADIPNDDGGEEGPEKMSKAREIRLEQNRKAARESRRRKKVLQEELQRSVIFFSRANGTLKQQNEELERMLDQARKQIQAIESGQAPSPLGQQQAVQNSAPSPASTQQSQQEKQQQQQLEAMKQQQQQQQQQQQLEALKQQQQAEAMKQQQLQQQQQQQQQQMENQNNMGGGNNPGSLDNSNLMNWMNFQAALGGTPGLMGFDPNNNPYTQALNQFALQQQQANQQPQSAGTPPSAPTPIPQPSAPIPQLQPQLQLPFGMMNPSAGMFPGAFGNSNPLANPFQFPQYGAAMGMGGQWQGGMGGAPNPAAGNSS